MIVENWTGHEVTVVLKGGKKIVLPVVGEVRVPIKEELAGYINVQDHDVPLKHLRRGATNLPSERPNIYLLVSQITRTENPQRKDLLSPADMVVRAGVTVGCRSFAMNEE